MPKGNNKRQKHKSNALGFQSREGVQYHPAALITITKQLKRGNPDISKHGFKKGKSGNPKGRPKKIPALDELLGDVLGEEKDGIEAAKAILMALRAKAIKGDVRAAEVLLDRAYGKAKQNIDHTTGGESFNLHQALKDFMTDEGDS